MRSTNYPYKVSYLHHGGTFGHPYRVARPFATEAEAEEFISVNAMVCALPGLQRDYPAAEAASTAPATASAR